ELTTGTPPFAAETDLEILNQIATGQARPPEWPAALGPYPPALAAIVMRALAPDPAARFASMRELQVALEGFAREAGLALSSVALTALMRDLFAAEIAAWHEAQRAGKTLADHLAARAAPAAATTDEPTVTDAFGAAPRRGTGRVTRALGMLAFAAVFAVAGGLAAKRWRSTGERPIHVAAPAAAPPVKRAPPPAPAAAPAPSAPTAVRPAAPAHRRARTSARAEAPAPSPAPESRLRTWDPDSPRPP
ncbi:MAG TPA: hypothetical protein VN962_22400, partial [Polyangia bacterium]|nr:hypothetical protein [Polyangia bacterium]